MTDYSLKVCDRAVQRYMQAAQLAFAAEQGQWADAGIKDGATVADIGCGPGAIALRLAQLVGPCGRVVGIDNDAAALAKARQLAGESCLENIDFKEGDAESTGLAPRSYDVVMMRNVLAHCGGREQQIVNHLASLVRPGGAVYIVDIELTGLRIYPSHRVLNDLSQKYLNFQEGQGNDMSIGLRLGELVTQAGLELEYFRGRYDMFDMRGFRGPAWEALEAMSSSGFIVPKDIVRYQEAFNQLEANETPPTWFVPFFVAVGRYKA
jgi:ubiquinone/menaquinone biosynthesis C-methylase UbiE